MHRHASAHAQPTQDIEGLNSAQLSQHSSLALSFIASTKSIDAMIYLQDIVEGTNSVFASPEIYASNANAEYDSDASSFCSISSAELQEEVINKPLEL